MSRETRLLLVTIAISVVLLLVLARFRFPQQPSAGPAGLVVAPLDRILARDALSDVASAVRNLSPVVNRAVIALRVTTNAEDVEPTGAAPAIIPALRLRDDLAIALVPPHARVLEAVGAPGERPGIVATDVVRGLVIVRVIGQAAPTLSLSTALDGNSAVIVAVVEGSQAGPSIRPAFLGQAAETRDPRWRSPLVPIDSQVAPAGAFVFTLDGNVAGLVVDSGSDAALVPAAELVEAGEALIAGHRPRAGDLGVEVQPLTGPLADATGATSGVVVRSVDPAGPAHDLLRPGDVVTAIDDAPVHSTRGFERHVAALGAGVSSRVAIVRLGDRLTITFAARDRPEPPPPRPAALVGARLVLVPGVGARVAEVVAGSPAEAAGVRTGDVITRLNGIEAPAPDQVERAWASAAAGSASMIVVARGGTPLVLAIRKP